MHKKRADNHQPLDLLSPPMKPKFKPTQDGLVIIDPIERRRYRLETNTPVTPTSVADDRIPYPMDTTVEITTDSIQLLSDNSVYVRKTTGPLLTEVQSNESVTLPRAKYILDLSGPIKVYVSVESAVHVHAGIGQTELTFGETTSVVISARSYHTSPAATITTSSDPEDMMQAVSMFGSALKTTATERSYPTLRGHPPAIELSDELDIPHTLSRPQTGIRIEVPPTLQHVFVVAPLAYYLAVEVVPGSTPQLVTDTGYTVLLEGTEGFEVTVSHLLKQIFLLDCIVRTEGETPLPLYERQALESALKFDIEDLYGRRLVEQLEAYLEVPFDTIRSQLPEWQFETRLKPRAQQIEYLPFLADKLATVRIREDASNPVRSSPTRVRTTGNHPYIKTNRTDQKISTRNDEITAEYDGEQSNIQQFWKDDNRTEIAGTGTLSAFQNSVTQSPRDGDLEIEVICNDPDMSEEFVAVHSAYQDRNDLPLDVAVHYDLTTDDFEDVFASESDFVHYIGHIDPEGFRCSDGWIDARELETVGTKAFVLNACQSYEQGLGLIEAGAIGGIVTFSEVQNETAVTAGSAIACLLNRGFPLYGALDTLQKVGESDQQYHIVGDGALSVVQTNQGLPTVGTIIQNRDSSDIILTVYTTSSQKLGGVYNIAVESDDSYRLAFGNVCLRSVTTAELVKFLNTETFPVLLEGELRWSTDIKTHEL